MSVSQPLPHPPPGKPPPELPGAEHGEVDPITLEVVCEGLIAIVREMRATIIRSSFSSVIYEFDDFSCALFGPGGEMVAQSWDHPGTCSRCRGGCAACSRTSRTTSTRATWCC